MTAPATARRRWPTWRRAGVSHQTVSRVLNGRPACGRTRLGGSTRPSASWATAATSPPAAGVGRGRARSAWSPGGPASSGRPRSCWAGEGRARRRLPADVGHHRGDLARGRARPWTRSMEHAPEAVIVVVPHETVLRIAQDDRPRRPHRGARGRPLADAADGGRRQRAGRPAGHRHLLDLGHPSVVHLAGPPGWNEAMARIEGWRPRLDRPGLHVPAPALGAATGPPGAATAPGIALARRRT